jgi:hypothetical protein
MYLVKWAGLGYEFCTWETREDINDATLIEAFHRLNNDSIDDSHMPERMIEDFINNAGHINDDNAGGISCIPILRAQLYAQTRAIQFVKFGAEPPEAVSFQSGPTTHAARLQHHPREIVECVADLVFQVSRRQNETGTRANTMLPPCLLGEYDTILPITSTGLMMNVGEVGGVAFLGYRKYLDGSKGPAEKAKLIRGAGDKIIAVNGVSTVGKTFKDVIDMLRESGKHKYAYMRFRETRYTDCNSHLCSAGFKGKYAIVELKKKFTSERKLLLLQRETCVIEEENATKLESDKDDDEASDSDGSDESMEGSEGEFQPDSEDDEIAENANTVAEKEETDKEMLNIQLKTAAHHYSPVANGHGVDALKKLYQRSKEDARPDLTVAVNRHETTRSLAMRLLDIDLGYSSDEGGTDECAYFIDGTDDTFTSMAEVSNLELQKEEHTLDETVPTRLNEFSTIGDRAKLAAAVALTSLPPILDDFDNFPYTSTKILAAQEATRKQIEEQQVKEELSSELTRSKVKVEQISVASGEVIHIWASIEAASATLQLPLPQLRQVLLGEYDEDIGDEVGGYKWRYALADAIVTAGMDTSSKTGAGKKAKEAWLEFRDKLYDPSEPHVYKNQNRLRDYQVDGVNWLASTWYRRQGAILADEMGLGKVCTCSMSSYVYFDVCCWRLTLLRSFSDCTNCLLP